jgi:hypothetical protein
LAEWYDEYDLPDRLESNLDDIIDNDDYLAGLIEDAFFDHVHGNELDYGDLKDYLAEEYGIDFDEVFDWDGWRDWYEG